VTGLFTSGLGFSASRKVIQLIPTPSTSLSWEAWSYGPLSFTETYNELQFYFWGTLSALAGNNAAIEISTITVALNSSNTPVVAIRSENSQYNLIVKLSNTTTGKAIYLRYPLKVDDYMEVDCDTRRIRTPHAFAPDALTLDSERVDWLNLVQGTNSLQWEEAGTDTVTVELEWHDKVAV
jgi:hypothetical protein